MKTLRIILALASMLLADQALGAPVTIQQIPGGDHAPALADTLEWQRASNGISIFSTLQELFNGPWASASPTATAQRAAGKWHTQNGDFEVHGGAV